MKLSHLVLLVTTLHLTGCAGLFIAGTAATANLVTDTRTTQEIWQDNQIEFEVAAIGNKPPFKGAVRMTSNAYNGKVVILGQATTEAVKNELAVKVKEIKGVKTVHNQIKIKPPLGVTEVSHDTWLTTKVKSKLLTAPELNGINIKVITEDKEVYLFGLVTQEQAEVATEIARNVSGVSQVIRAFEYGTTTNTVTN